ncbi:MAG: hypothetical protein K2X38_01630 [Gemmataceae bacterium]|nr:hypothetical protein [Gemmataceae bacterium]
MIHEAKNGKKFDVCGLQVGTKWWCVIYPTDATGKAIARGLILAEPHAVQNHGPFVTFDTEDAAIQAGKNVIEQDFMNE